MILRNHFIVLAKMRNGGWYRFFLPRRLTLKVNPPIYRWLFWNFGPEIDETPIKTSPNRNAKLLQACEKIETFRQYLYDLEYQCAGLGVGKFSEMQVHLLVLEDKLLEIKNNPNAPYRTTLLESLISRQKEWIKEHGGDLAGYIARYGSSQNSSWEPLSNEEYYGAGGEAIYAADVAELERLEKL